MNDRIATVLPPCFQAKKGLDTKGSKISIAYMRKIIHIDMDAYYAAVEIRENPAFRGKPLIVGGSPNSRGVVSTCSYEARVYGIRSGMASSQAWKLCPSALFVYPNFALYKEVSAQIREIFFSYTDFVEPMSLDEAYLDVTENKVGEAFATHIAKEIKNEILAKTRLTCSAGVSYNKFLAKIGSELNKPNGLCVIPPQRAQEVLFALPIEKFHGIGKVTAAKMKKLGIHNGFDLFQWEMKDLYKTFGKYGLFYYNVIRGIDDRQVITEHDPKSISNENTFATDIDDVNEILAELRRITTKLASRMDYKNIQGQNLNLKIKYDNFEIITRSTNLPYQTKDADLIFATAERLFFAHWDHKRKIRLIGVGVNKLDCDGEWNNEQMMLRLFG